MKDNIQFIKNLVFKLEDNIAALNIIINDESYNYEHIILSISQRDLIIKAISKLSFKIKQEIDAGTLGEMESNSFNQLNSTINKLVIQIQEQYQTINRILAQHKEILSKELKHVSINKSKIKGYNLNSVK
jgi:hypothetical protein